jgi:hypothetical protein
LTWEKSTQNLLEVILGGHWYQQWMPDDMHRFWGGDSRLCSEVGKRLGRDIMSTGQAGYLIYGPYIPLGEGQYQVVIRGSLGEDGAGAARIEVAIEQGTRILAQSALTKFGENDCLFSLPLSLDEPCTDLEVRVWVDGQSKLTISMLEISSDLEGADNRLPSKCERISPSAEGARPTSPATFAGGAIISSRASLPGAMKQKDQV